MKKKLKLLILSAMISITFLISQKILGAQNTNQVDHHNVKRVVQKHLSDNPDLLDSSKGKDIVVFLGNTGSGKSTLINFLSGKQLEVDSNYGIKLVNPNDPSAMAIGGGSTSETFLPKFIQVSGSEFYDLPGFMDTRGTAENLVNACFIKRIIENAKSAKLVFVVGLDQITANRGDSFIKLSKQVKQLIPNKNIENFSSLIITQSYLPKVALSSFIEAKLTPEINQNPDLSILKFWIKNGKIDQMSRPITPLIDLTQKTDILNLIGIIGSDQVTCVDIGVIYDINQQLKIKDIYGAEIQDIIESLISQNFQVQNSQIQGLSALDKGSLETKKTYMINGFKPGVCSNLNGSSLIKLLRPISENLYQQSWYEKKQVLAIRINEIIAQINAEIHQKQRQEEEARRIQAEAIASQAQEDARVAREAAARAEQALRDYIEAEEIGRLKPRMNQIQWEIEQKRAGRQWANRMCFENANSIIGHRLTEVRFQTEYYGRKKLVYPDRWKCLRCNLTIDTNGNVVEQLGFVTVPSDDISNGIYKITSGDEHMKNW